MNLIEQLQLEEAKTYESLAEVYKLDNTTHLKAFLDYVLNDIVDYIYSFEEHKGMIGTQLIKIAESVEQLFPTLEYTSKVILFHNAIEAIQETYTQLMAHQSLKDKLSTLKASVVAHDTDVNPELN